VEDEDDINTEQFTDNDQCIDNSHSFDNSTLFDKIFQFTDDSIDRYDPTNTLFSYLEVTISSYLYSVRNMIYQDALNFTFFQELLNSKFYLWLLGFSNIASCLFQLLLRIYVPLFLSISISLISFYLQIG
jgi:hypothetical protein